MWPKFSLECEWANLARKNYERINALKQSKNVKFSTINQSKRINQIKRIGTQNTNEIILKYMERF